MKNNYSIAALKRIGDTKKQRSVIMSERRRIGWSRKTKAERLAHSRVMNGARWPSKK